MSFEDLHRTLVEAANDGQLDCDRLEMYRTYDELPDSLRAPPYPISGTDESYIFAWRNHARVGMMIMAQMIEQVDIAMLAVTICADLNVQLDRLERVSPQPANGSVR